MGRTRGLGLLGINLEFIRNGATTCPQCSDSRKKNNQRCLSVNMESGHVNCSHCGWNARADSDEWLDKKNTFKPMDNDIKPSEFATVPLSAEGVEYLKCRGISAGTIQKHRIAGDDRNIIFNYYRDNTIVLAKYRGLLEKKFFAKGQGRSLFNIDSLKSRDIAIITEGEIDVLSFTEAGMPYAVSVDFGAPGVNDSTVDNKLKCLEACQKDLSRLKKVYVAVDADAPGERLRDELIRRLGRDKCLVVKFPEDCKDANDVLVKHGPDMLCKCIDSAKPTPITGITLLQDIWPEMVEQYHNGLRKGISTNILSLDGHFSWLPGELTLFTGLPNSGKSEMVKFMLAKMIRQGWKFAVFSPETYPASSFYVDWIHTYTGKNPDKDFPNQIPFEEFKDAAEFIRDHVFYVYPEGNEHHTPDVIREKIKEMSLTYGLNGYVIDPWNMLLHEKMDRREDLYISDQLTQFTRVNHEHDLIGIIIAHPKAIQEGTVPNPYHHISGGPMFINKCDNAIVIHRPNYAQDKQDRQVDFMIEKIRRQKLVGVPTTVSFAYDRRTAQHQDLNSSQFPTGAKVMNQLKQSIQGHEDEKEELPF